MSGVRRLWSRTVRFLAFYGFLKHLPDRAYLKLIYKCQMGKKPDLEHPATYNEKLQWLKLHDHDPRYPHLADKCEVKQFVKEKIGEQYLIPTLGVFETFDDIDFDALPRQFVIKCTHDSGSTVICRDKTTFDIEACRKKIQKALRTNYYLRWREWPYQKVKRRIMVEAYLEDEQTRELCDYKFFVFDGVVKAMFIAANRYSDTKELTFDFYDRDFAHLPIRQGHPNADAPQKRPATFDEMIRLAETLAADLPHARVDFYEANGRIYFGEITFYHFSGAVPFEPETWDKTFGDWLRLPASKRETGEET